VRDGDSVDKREVKQEILEAKKFKTKAKEELNLRSKGRLVEPGVKKITGFSVQIKKSGGRGSKIKF
jgi:hypothetical protein